MGAWHLWARQAGHPVGLAARRLLLAPTALWPRARQTPITVTHSHSGALNLVSVLFILSPYCGSYCLQFATFYNGLLMHTLLNNLTTSCHHPSEPNFFNLLIKSPASVQSWGSPFPVERAMGRTIPRGVLGPGVTRVTRTWNLGGVTHLLSLEGREHMIG